MLSRLTSAHYEKIVTMDQNVGLQAFMEKPRLGKTLPPANPRHNVLSNAGQHPKIRTSSFAISHTRLAALPWGPRLAIGRRRRELHRRRSGLDSHLRWRSGKGPQLAKRLPDTQPSRIRRVSSGGVAEKIGSTPLWRTSVHTRRER